MRILTYSYRSASIGSTRVARRANRRRALHREIRDQSGGRPPRPVRERRPNHKPGARRPQRLSHHHPRDASPRGAQRQRTPISLLRRATEYASSPNVPIAASSAPRPPNNPESVTISRSGTRLAST